MISAFVSRELVIIQGISDMILDEVNKQRLEKVYADEEAAIKILGSSRKMPITKSKSPFLLFFEELRREQTRVLDIQQHGHPVQGCH